MFKLQRKIFEKKWTKRHDKIAKKVNKAIDFLGLRTQYQMYNKGKTYLRNRKTQSFEILYDKYKK